MSSGESPDDLVSLGVFGNELGVTAVGVSAGVEVTAAQLRRAMASSTSSISCVSMNLFSLTKATV